MTFFCLSNAILAGPKNLLESHRKNATKLTDQLKLSKDKRLSVDSGWFYLDENNTDFFMTYNAWDNLHHKRKRTRQIFQKALQMIKSAQHHIVASFFLFDNMYSSTIVDLDIVEKISNTLIEKKRNNPGINIALILDPLHRSYARRASDKVKEFLKNGIDVFYSDLLSTDSATRLKISEAFNHSASIINQMTLGMFGSLFEVVSDRIRFPYELDGQNVSISTILGASLMKANHRKVLVTDIGEKNLMEALVTSANPHNASDDSTNTAISIRGELAKYIYGVLREDIAQSLLKQKSLLFQFGHKKYAALSDTSKDKYNLSKINDKGLVKYLLSAIPPVDFETLDQQTQLKDVRAKFVSEGKVKKEILRILGEAQPEDKVRIQMFYLSEPAVVEAIKKVSQQRGRKHNPVLLLLDPSKDAFNEIKDGTPNRQVAHYLVSWPNAKLELRWYNTHGEQNHAKVMSVTNERTDKYQITTGSTNWTGKNMNDINMEANLVVENSPKLNKKFNTLFDQIFYNQDGLLYTENYDFFNLSTTRTFNLGYKKYQSMNEAQKQRYIQENRDDIYAVFTRENASFLATLDPRSKKQWLQEKIVYDQGAVIRAICLLEGEKQLGPKKKSLQDAWTRKYMNKWIRGERWGHVAW